MPALRPDPKLLTLLNVFAIARATREELHQAAISEPRDLTSLAPRPAVVLARFEQRLHEDNSSAHPAE